MAKYDPLGAYLRSQTAAALRLPLSDVEKLVGKLPADAQTAQFWANAHDYGMPIRTHSSDASSCDRSSLSSVSSMCVELFHNS